MLILARSVDEVIQIGNDIEIVVCRIGKDSVRLGIRAPENVRVMRKELQERIDVEGERGRQK